jgi:hypothetical protein
MNSAIAALLLGLAPSAAAAQSHAPPLAGPYYNTGGNPTGYSFAAAGTRERMGDLATITRITLLAAAREVEGLAVGRFDTVIEFNCATREMRPIRIAARGMTNELLKVISRADDPWSRIAASDPGSALELALACDGTIPEGRPVVSDIDARITRFRATGQ